MFQKNKPFVYSEQGLVRLAPSPDACASFGNGIQLWKWHWEPLMLGLAAAQAHVV
jgi:hypothetical protein